MPLSKWGRATTGPARRRVPSEVPAAAATIARGSSLRCVWQNSLGGLTFEVADGSRFLKWAPAGSPLRLLEEAERMRWAHRYTPVPDVLDAGTADDGSTWLLTAALPGTTAVADRWKASPRVAVCALGEGLRAFHEALPVAECPFTCLRKSGWYERRQAPRPESPFQPFGTLHIGTDARRGPGGCRGAATGRPARGLSRRLMRTEHARRGRRRWSGHVDLGRMGTGDRWADLAVATWSTGWNYGAGWEGELLDAYGVGPDIARIRYYRLLWDLTD